MDVLDIVYSMNTVDSLQDNINYALKNLHKKTLHPVYTMDTWYHAQYKRKNLRWIGVRGVCVCELTLPYGTVD